MARVSCQSVMATVWASPCSLLLWKDPKSGETSRGYREDGYFPEAVINFLALLGWNPGTEQELFTLDELVPLFDITKCSKAGAKFAYEKAIWFNHEYILKKSNEEIAALFEPIVKEHCPNETSERVWLVTRDDERPRERSSRSYGPSVHSSLRLPLPTMRKR